MGRIGTPREVAQAALYLASASFVTGQVLAVELDERLIPLLRGFLAEKKNLTLVQGDIMRQDLAALTEGYENLTLRVNRDETFAILADGEEVTLPGATTAEKVPETQPTEPVELITEAPQ